MTKDLSIRNSTIDFLVFTKQAGEDGINVHVEDETVWVTVEAIAKLFDRARTTITEHIQNIYSSGELDKESTCRKFRHMGENGQEYFPKYNNLDMIISVGYRVDSIRATQFRQWATRVLKHIPMTMQDWAGKLDFFLTMNDEKLLVGKGTVSHEEAKIYAESEFEKYRLIQDALFKSDFDLFAIALDQGIES